MSLVKMMLSFAPWIAFLILARNGLAQVKFALAVAFVVNVAMAVTRLHRGALMWAGNIFFLFALIAIGGFNNMWALKHLGVLANGALAAGVIGGMFLGKPFTLEYAKQNVDPSRWSDPGFVRTNMILSGAWGGVFVVNMGFAWAKMTEAAPEAICEILSYSGLIGTALFTRWYAARAHRKAEAAQVSA